MKYSESLVIHISQLYRQRTNNRYYINYAIKLMHTYFAAIYVSLDVRYEPHNFLTRDYLTILKSIFLLKISEKIIIYHRIEIYVTLYVFITAYVNFKPCQSKIHPKIIVKYDLVYFLT